MAAGSMTDARRTPLIAAVPKMFFPALVILPGMIALALPTPQQAVTVNGVVQMQTVPVSEGVDPSQN